MKKLLSILAAVVLLTGCLAACGKNAANGGKRQIVTTVFSEYDWVMNILGEKAADFEVTMLLDSGVDLHSFQPTVNDMVKIAGCDLFVCVGGESDKWVDDALRQSTNQNRAVIRLMDVLGGAVKEEETVEGMQAEDEEEEGDEVEYDEHVWLSLRNAAVFVGKLSETIQKIDADNAAVYQKNAAAYIEKLNALDAEYQAAVSAAAVKTLLFADRFPFRYLTDDYGLRYYAAFVGCSTETKANFSTVTFLAQKVDELSLRAVMTIEGSDHSFAETIVQNTKAKNQQILTLDSMQSVTAKDVENGAAYLTVMKDNLSVLKNALQ